MRTITGKGAEFKCYIQETATGKQLLGSGARLLGTYNKNEDKTYRPGGQFYSNGDCLMELRED